MPPRQKELKCLICKAATIHAHMGIEACRPCAVFYKRSIKLKYNLLCVDGTENCSSRDKIISCRKCRFDRFKEIYERASAGVDECTVVDQKAGGSVEEKMEESRNDAIEDKTEEVSDLQHSNSPQKTDTPSSIANDENSQHQCSEEPSPSFIDHTSFYSSDQSLSSTPLLDKMKRAYSTLCLVRKSGEMSAIHHLLMHMQLKNEKMAVRPAKYSDMIPYSHIFFSAVIDFARSAFKDFGAMSAEDRHTLVESNFQLIMALDSSYRGAHYFPNDDTVMATYATYVNDETLPQFLVDCPPEVNKDQVAEEVRKNYKHTAKKGKLEFVKGKPTIEEFLTLFGLALWNDYTGNFEADMAAIIKRNREAILKELRTIYSRRGCTEYAPRMGKVLCLLTNEERCLDVTREHIQIYRMMHMFNEAYDDEKK